MSISDFRRYALGFCAAFALLAGCGNGAQSQLAPSAPFRQSGAQSWLGQFSTGLANTTGSATTGVIVPYPDHGPSWMAPDAKAQNLLYLTNYGANDVLVFSYPQDKLVGTLTGPFNLPDGDCTDKKGDVWIVNNAPSWGIVEYEHGGTNPIATLQDYGYYADACVVDPTTGNLIVTNHQTYFSSAGNVAIYAHAKGSAKLYPVAGVSFVFFCAFDDKGNLYVDGLLVGTGFQLPNFLRAKPRLRTSPSRAAQSTSRATFGRSVSIWGLRSGISDRFPTPPLFTRPLVRAERL